MWWWREEFLPSRSLTVQSISLKESRDPLIIQTPPVGPNTFLVKASDVYTHKRRHLCFPSGWRWYLFLPVYASFAHLGYFRDSFYGLARRMQLSGKNTTLAYKDYHKHEKSTSCLRNVFRSPLTGFSMHVIVNSFDSLVLCRLSFSCWVHVEHPTRQRKSKCDHSTKHSDISFFQKKVVCCVIMTQLRFVATVSGFLFPMSLTFISFLQHFLFVTAQ